jgi:hypothetical protein
MRLLNQFNDYCHKCYNQKEKITSVKLKPGNPMPLFKSSKFSSRLVQPAIEDNDPSLLARAFRRRVLGGPEVDPALLYLGTNETARVPVAVYNAKRPNTARFLRKIGLTIVAPLLAIFIVGVIIMTTLTPAKVSQPIASESVVLADVPVPANVRPIPRAKTFTQQQFITVYLNQLLPNYSSEFKGAASYMTSRPFDEVNNFYITKLLQTKSLLWQTYGKPTTYNLSYTSLYLRALSSQVSGSVEALVVQLEPVDSVILKTDPTFYDSQAKPGETVIILSKAWLVPR